jgi:hypothetical protein
LQKEADSQIESRWRKAALQHELDQGARAGTHRPELEVSEQESHIVTAKTNRLKRRKNL